MKKEKIIPLDFIIDKLTNSITNTISGDSFLTEVSSLNNLDIKGITKKSGWIFNWVEEFNNNTREVYKLSIVNNTNIIQGLLSFTVKQDHVFMNLIESAPFNLGKNKLYEGVAGNIVAFACKVSFQRGFNGFVSFTAKTKLILHYEKSLGAYHFANQLMIINTDAAKLLVDKYFRN